MADLNGDSAGNSSTTNNNMNGSNDVSTEPQAKRGKIAPAVDLSVLAPHLLEEATIAENRKRYVNAAPYSHCVFSPLCPTDLLTKVRDEIVGTLETKFKETDLFKLYQTTDLANVDSTNPELAAKLPTLLQLRDALYSGPFRRMISRIAGCGELTDRVDMAASAYAEGCHLLCHDDVIGSRAVSFIIYFSAEDWTEKDGGALELFPLEKSSQTSFTRADKSQLEQGVPSTIPAARLLPLFNTMAFFRVEPGRSYHAVQEVMREGSPRLSIQGWFHAASEPEGTEMASLNQLKIARAETEAPVSIPGLTPKPEPQTAPDSEPPAVDTELTADERAYLARFLNEAYLKDDALQALSAKFEDESSLQLRKFLHPSLGDAVHGLCMDADVKSNLQLDGLPPDATGMGGGWIARGPAHMQRFLTFPGPDATTNGDSNGANAPQDNQAEAVTAARLAGQKLHEIKTELFQSTAFAKWLQRVTGGRLSAVTSQIRRFRPGLDYTVAHHGQLEKDIRLDVTLCFVREESEQATAVWASGDVGGFQCYLAAENEDNVAAEVYCDDDAEGNDLLSVSASTNTLSIVLRDTGTMRFVKYLSGCALSSRWDILNVYDIAYDDDDEEDGDDEDHEEDEAPNAGEDQSGRSHEAMETTVFDAGKAESNHHRVDHGGLVDDDEDFGGDLHVDGDEEEDAEGDEDENEEDEDEDENAMSEDEEGETGEAQGLDEDEDDGEDDDEEEDDEEDDAEEEANEGDFDQINEDEDDEDADMNALGDTNEDDLYAEEGAQYDDDDDEDDVEVDEDGEDDDEVVVVDSDSHIVVDDNDEGDDAEEDGDYDEHAYEEDEYAGGEYDQDETTQGGDDQAGDEEDDGATYEQDEDDNQYVEDDDEEGQQDGGDDDEDDDGQYDEDEEPDAEDDDVDYSEVDEDDEL